MSKIELSLEMKLHLIEHLEGEIQWWQNVAIGGSTCPDCCADEDEDNECLYREAKRLLIALKEGDDA